MTDPDQDARRPRRRWSRPRPTKGPSKAISFAALIAALLMVGYATAPRSTTQTPVPSDGIQTLAAR